MTKQVLANLIFAFEAITWTREARIWLPRVLVDQRGRRSNEITRGYLVQLLANRRCLKIQGMPDNKTWRGLKGRETLQMLFGFRAFERIFQARDEGEWDKNFPSGLSDKQLVLARLKFQISLFIALPVLSVRTVHRKSGTHSAYDNVRRKTNQKLSQSPRRISHLEHLVYSRLDKALQEHGEYLTAENQQTKEAA